MFYDTLSIVSHVLFPQAEQIDEIHNMTMKSSENVNDGNEYVKKVKIAL